MLRYCCVLFLFLSVAGVGQSPVVIHIKKEKPDTNVYTLVEKPAEFPGGMRALYEYISFKIPADTLKVLLANGYSGTAYVKFIIDLNGSVSNVVLLKGIPGCMACDKKAIQAVKDMPRWIPGMNGNKAVRSYFNLPIRFKIQ